MLFRSTLGSGGVLAIGGGILASMASDAIFDRFVGVASHEANIKQEPSFEEWAPNDTAKQSADQAWPDENQIILERTLFRKMEKSILENNLLEFQRLQRQLKPEN